MSDTNITDRDMALYDEVRAKAGTALALAATMGVRFGAPIAIEAFDLSSAIRDPELQERALGLLELLADLFGQMERAELEDVVRTRCTMPGADA